MLAPYRSVLATPGAPAFTVAGLIARLPIATIGLGTVLLIAGRTGSYGLAGSISAVGIAAEALASPVLARVVDRIGQARVLVPAMLVFTLGVVGMVASVESGAARWTTYLCSAVTGAALPPVGAMVRARWTHALGDGPGLHTAFSLEAVNDELVFMTGPVLVTLLATQVHEAAGLLTVAVLALSSGLWLASQRATEPTEHSSAGPHDERLPLLWLVAMVCISASLGSLFGATEVVTVAFAQEQGHTPLAGLLLATWALGSMLAGVVTGAVAWSASSLSRFRWGTFALFVVMVPLPFIDNLPVMFLALFVAGFAISPTLVATISLVEAGVPATRLTEGITWVMTGIAIGVAPGAAFAGHLIDAHGASTAYVVPIVSGMVATAVAWMTRPPVSGPSATVVTGVTGDPGVTGVTDVAANGSGTPARVPRSGT